VSCTLPSSVWTQRTGRRTIVVYSLSSESISHDESPTCGAVICRVDCASVSRIIRKLHEVGKCGCSHPVQLQGSFWLSEAPSSSRRSLRKPDQKTNEWNAKFVSVMSVRMYPWKLTLRQVRQCRAIAFAIQIKDGGHHLNGEMAYQESSNTLCRGRVQREDE
jgi:hypothetical protein